MGQFEQDLLDLLPRLRRFTRSLTRNRVDADDLCQAVIERALKHRDRKRRDARLDGWIFMIARNLWIDWQRKAQREGGRFLSLDGVDSLAHQASASREPGDAIDIHRAMNALPPEQREAAALVWVEGYAYREAADLLGIPVGTLTSRLSRARTRLIGCMEVT